MAFSASTYVNLVTQRARAEENLFLRYIGPRNDFDIIIVGSGMGGGVLADALADRFAQSKRILVLEAGSFIYPTHVYNLCRFPNFRIAKHYGCDTFWQAGNEGTQYFIGEKPQLNLGGRSIFWSGLIPMVQEWELAFFPERVRSELTYRYLAEAGLSMNESVSMGTTARRIVDTLRQSPLAQDFIIEETPRALHQPYMNADGTPNDEFFMEPTGVFNTAELLINQLGLTPGVSHGDYGGLQLLPNHFVEDVQNHGDHFELVTRNTLTGEIRIFLAATVVLAGGSIESPKLLQRSTSLFNSLPGYAQAQMGRGLTDHPTSNEVAADVTHIGNIEINKRVHAKIILHSKGLRDAGQIRYPFNVEMNINHEYWHLRENDPFSPDATATSDSKASRLDIKFSFGNCLDDGNEIRVPPPFGYIPEIVFRNQSWTDHLVGSRLPALAGWIKTDQEVFGVMNSVADQIFSQFAHKGQTVRLGSTRFGQGLGFGWGTVHHAAGSLRMPFKTAHDAGFDFNSVVDEDLRVAGTDRLYVCDMSVMPFSSAGNPVRTLVALALRLSRHLV
jgi:hypothetical protein